MAVLVDSSVWIVAQNPKNTECLRLKRLISEDEVIYIIRPIQVEVCQGARTEELFHRLWESFLGFEFLDITDRHWGLAARNYFRCRKKGITPTTLDCLIATLASDYQVPLWSLDRNLARMQRVIGFDRWD